MIDAPSPKSTKTEAELEIERLKDAADKAWAAARAAVAEYGQAQYRLASLRGYLDGFIEGRKAIFEEMKQHVAAARAPSPPQVDVPPPPRVTIHKAPMFPATSLLMGNASQQSAKEIVLQAARDNPGLLGIELLTKIRDQGIEMHERTFRTALFRLKTPASRGPLNGDLVSFRNRWYVYPNVPAGYVHALLANSVDIDSPDYVKDEEDGQ